MGRDFDLGAYGSLSTDAIVAYEKGAVADVDWRFSKKFDAYAGAMVSKVKNGLSSGYPHGVDFAPTAELRLRF